MYILKQFGLIKYPEKMLTRTISYGWHFYI